MVYRHQLLIVAKLIENLTCLALGILFHISIFYTFYFLKNFQCFLRKFQMKKEDDKINFQGFVYSGQTYIRSLFNLCIF